MPPVESKPKLETPPPSSEVERIVEALLVRLAKRGFFDTRMLEQSGPVQIMSFDAFTGDEEQSSALAVDAACKLLRRDVKDGDWATYGTVSETLLLVCTMLDQAGGWFLSTKTIASVYTDDTTWLGLRSSFPHPGNIPSKLALHVVKTICKYGCGQEDRNVRYDGPSFGRVLHLLSGEVRRTVNGPSVLLNYSLAKLLGRRNNK